MVRSPRDGLLLAAVLGTALILRAGALLAQPEGLSRDADVDAYLAIAEQLAAGNGFAGLGGEPTAFRPPLYPLILAGLLALGGGPLAVGILHLVLGLATVWLTFEVGRRLGLGRAAFAAGALVAVDPLLVRYTASPMTEVLFTFVVVLLLWLVVSPILERRRGAKWLLVGIIFGLAALCRPTIWVYGGLVAGTWAVLTARQAWREPSWRLLIRQLPWPVLVGTAVVVSPWLVRNMVVFGNPILTTTHGGYTLLLGNNPVFYREVVAARWGTVWERQSLEAWQASLHRRMRSQDPPVVTEPEQDRWMYEQAWRNIAAEPGMFLRASWLRFRRFWNVVPLESAVEPLRNFADRLFPPDVSNTAVLVVRWGVGLFYSAVIAGMLLGLVRLTRAEWPRWTPLVLLIAGFTVVHLLYWSNARMRAPLVPAIALLAARGYCCWRAERSRGMPRDPAEAGAAPRGH